MCLRSDIFYGYHVEFEDLTQQQGFWAIASGRNQPQQSHSRWLRERALLEGPSHYDPATSNAADFVRQIEVDCSIDPGTAIEVVDDFTVTLRNDFVGPIGSHGSNRMEKQNCGNMAVLASNLDAHGVRFVIFGAEVPVERQSP